MFRVFRVTSLQLVAVAALAVATPLSMAHGNPSISWSITSGTPAPRIYVPAPVYVQPAPVYVRPVPAFGYGRPSYYVEEVRPAPRWHHHRHGHDHGGWYGHERGGWHGRN